MGPWSSILENCFEHATFSFGAVIKAILLVGQFILNPFQSTRKPRLFLLSNISPSILRSKVWGRNIYTLDVVAVVAYITHWTELEDFNFPLWEMQSGWDGECSGESNVCGSLQSCARLLRAPWGIYVSISICVSFLVQKCAFLLLADPFFLFFW